MTRLVPTLETEISPKTDPLDRKVRVVMVAPSLRYVGGVAVQADTMMRVLEGDPDIYVGLVPMDPDLPRSAIWVENIRFVRTLVRAPLYWKNLWRGIEEANVVQIFGTSYWSFLLTAVPAWLIARCQKKAVLLHYHNGHARDHLTRFRSGRFILANCDIVVVPSKYLVDVLSEFGLSAAVIPNVIDSADITYRHRPLLRPNLLCTRGFGKDYGIDIVVQAFARVKAHLSDASLVLLGSGPLERDIRELVARLNLKGVSFPGAVPHRHIARFYHQADVFVNASNVDAMPVSVIEAFRAGTPVISTSPEAMPYLVEHGITGLLSPVGDPDALAHNVIRLFKERDLARDIARNAHLAATLYEWSVVRGSWCELYRSLRVHSELSEEARTC